MENNFKIVFSGEILPDHDIRQVRGRLASLLRKGDSEVNAYFSGKAFIKDRLDFVTANKYRKAFAKAGAVCRILAIVECPECGQRHKKAKKCINCGFVKDSASGQMMLRSKEDVKGEADISPLREDLKNKASRGMGLGVILLIAAFFIDSLAQKYYYHADLLWIYFLGIPPMVYGCVHYAKVKGYPGILGTIGVTTLFGISVLLLLPDKTAAEHQRHSRKETLTGLLIILVSLIWAYQQYVKWNDLNILIQKRTELETSLKPEAPLPLESVLTGMQDFLDQGFQILDRHRNHRPVIFVQMTGIVFESLERLFFIFQYQSFLRYLEDEEAYLIYDEEEMSAFKKELLRHFQQKILELDDERVLIWYREWVALTYSYHSGGNSIQWQMAFDEHTDHFIGKLSDATSLLQRIIRFYFRNEDELPRNREELFSAGREYQEEKSDRGYSFPEDVENTFSVDINDSEMLTLTVKKGVFAGETVIFGMLVVEREAYFSKEMVLRPELLRIGGTLPDRYRARYSVLHVGASWDHDTDLPVWSDDEE